MTTTYDIRRALRAWAAASPSHVQRLVAMLCWQLRTAARNPDSIAARTALMHSVKRLVAAR